MDILAVVIEKKRIVGVDKTMVNVQCCMVYHMCLLFITIG